MKKAIRNILIGSSIIGISSAIIRFRKNKKNVLKNEEDIEKKYYELGVNDTERKYIKLCDVNKSKIEKLASELEEVKEKKKTM